MNGIKITDGIKLVAFDLDGTLLRKDKSLSSRTINTLKQAAERGIILVPATGRLYKALPEELKGLPGSDYAICINGAEVVDERSNSVVYKANLTGSEVKAILAKVGKFSGITGFYAQGEAWMSEKDYPRIDECYPKEMTVMMKQLYQPVTNITEALNSVVDGVQKIIFLFPDLAERTVVYNMLQREMPEFAVTSSLATNVEINSKYATKGLALTKLCNHLGIELKNCMAFGDDTNDLSMLRCAGVGVAMGNAVYEVKKEADLITATNDEDGVAQIISSIP